MKYIKTFEGLIKQMHQDIKSIKTKYEKEIADCLSVIEHEHDLKLKSIGEYSFEYTATDLNILPTPELQRDFKLTKKKLEALGLDIEVSFSLGDGIKHSSGTKTSFLRGNLIDLEHNNIKQIIRGITIKILDMEDID
jgi:hypothetical protein